MTAAHISGVKQNAQFIRNDSYIKMPKVVLCSRINTVIENHVPKVAARKNNAFSCAIDSETFLVFTAQM